MVFFKVEKTILFMCSHPTCSKNSELAMTLTILYL